MKVDLNDITLLQGKLSKIVSDFGLQEPSNLSRIKSLVEHLENTFQNSEDSLEILKSQSEIRKFVEELGDSINTD